MSENKDEIAALFDHEEFEQGFEKICKFEFKNYERQLWRVYNDSSEIYTKLKVLYKLRKIFRNILPDVVLSNLSKLLNKSDF